MYWERTGLPEVNPVVSPATPPDRVFGVETLALRRRLGGLGTPWGSSWHPVSWDLVAFGHVIRYINKNSFNSYFLNYDFTEMYLRRQVFWKHTKKQVKQKSQM